ncbi:MAG: hypothetical protein IT304_12305 [Dehalococcoidia bacterium]|nr:hypothetical protein [Dehalococcoidia bacterium]
MWRGLLVTLALWAGGALILRATVAAAEHCPSITADEALAGATEAAAWIARVQRPDGSYLYEYNAAQDAETPAYNVVRHAGVTMSLYQLAAGGVPDFLPAADRATAWMVARLYRHDDWQALQDADGGIETGASALMLAGLAQRRLATNDPTFDFVMRALARFLLAMQQADGSYLLTWDRAASAPDPRERSKYATGEAFWALALMHRLFPGEGWDAAARAVADYLSLHRDRIEQQKFPPWADQWAAYGLAEMAAWPEAASGPVLSEANVRYARSLAERFGFLVRVDSRRTDSWLSKLLHGRRARGAGIGTWVEALDSLWRLTGADGRMADMRPKVAERAVCSAGMLRDRQVSPARAATFARPDLALGAWYTDGVTRMDDQQHALSGMLRAREILASQAAARP